MWSQSRIEGDIVPNNCKTLRPWRRSRPARQVEALEPRQLFAAGALDTSFGTNGITLFSTGANLKMVDSAQQADGKTIILLTDGKGTTSQLARFDTNGSLDTTFGTNGVISVPGLGQFPVYSTLAIQSNQKIVVAGGAGSIGLTRFNTNGTIDTTFGTGGSTSISASGSGFNVADLTVRSDDRLVLGGSISIQSKLDTDFGLFALTADGKSDTAFNGGSPGIATDFVGGNDFIRAIAILSDGRIVASGSAENVGGIGVLGIALYNADGTLDTGFSSDGKLTNSALSVAAASKLAIQNGTGIVLLDASGPKVDVAKFTTAGTLDTTFGGGTGIQSSINTETIGSAFSGVIVVEPAGLIVIAYDVAAAGGDKARLVRLLPNGAIDTTFNESGQLASAGFAAKNDELLLGPSNTLLVATAITNNDLVLARYDGSHAPKPTLGTAIGDAGTATIAVSVTYTGEASIDPTSVAVSNVRLDGPKSYSQIASSFSNVVSNGNTLSVTYQFPAPGSSLDPSDSGRYQISAKAAGVSDSLGNIPTAGNFGQFDLTVVAASIDLAFSDRTISAGTYSVNDIIPANLVARATGGVVNFFGLEVALSVDNIAGNADDISLVSLTSTPTNTPITELGPISDRVTAGKYFLVARLDPDNRLDESNETNNLLISTTPSITIVDRLPAAPSLAIGGLDPRFGTGGLIRLGFGWTSTVGVVPQSDGSFLIAGSQGAPGSRNIGIARRTSDGNADPTFGGGNITADLRGTDDRVVAYSAVEGGGILVAGTSAESTGGGSDFFVAKFNADGSRDLTFGTQGHTFINFELAGATSPSVDVARAMLVDAEGRIIVVGRTGTGGAVDMALARLNADGTLDTSFGTNGKTTTDFEGGDDAARAAAFSADGSIIVAGFATQTGSKHIAVAEYLATGILNPKFGKAGKATATAGGGNEQASSVAVSDKGLIVISGFSSTGTIAGGDFDSRFVVVEFSSKGKLNTKFGTAGITSADFADPAASTFVEFLPDGRILTSGVRSPTIRNGVSGQFDIAIVRFSNKGILDTTFGSGGNVVIPTTQGAGLAPSLLRPSAARKTGAPVLNPFGTTADDALDDFQETAEGQLSNHQGGGAYLAGTNDDDTVVANIVTSGVELSGELVAKLPSAVIGGAKGSLTVNVINLGDTIAAGPIDITYYVSTDQDVGSGDREISVLSGTTLNLKPLSLGGKAKKFKLKFLYPTDIADGAYYLLAQVNATRSLSELNPNNDTAFSGTAVQVTAPFVDLTGNPLAGNFTLTSGKKGSIPVTLANLGNVALKQTVGLKVYFSLDTTLDANDIALEGLTAKLSLKGNATKTVKLSVIATIPTAGDYYLFVAIDPANQVIEKDDTNNLLSSALASHLLAIH